jgi:hypothetical protein
MPDKFRLPAWQWDDKRACLVPLCPDCGGEVRQSGGSLVCMRWGTRHYLQSLSAVVEAVRNRLNDDSPA